VERVERGDVADIGQRLRGAAFQIIHRCDSGTCSGIRDWGFGTAAPVALANAQSRIPPKKTGRRPKPPPRLLYLISRCRRGVRRSSGQTGLCFLGDHAKRLDVVHGDVGQDLAVHRDTGLAQAIDQAAVGQAEHARGGVDADDPQRAELALALLAADIRVLTGLDDGLVGNAEDLATGVVVALGTTDDFLVTTTGGNATLYTSHGLSPRLQYGNMRATPGASHAFRWFLARRPRFNLVDFLVRMCDR